MNLFRYDNKLNTFLSRVTDFMILNVLWIICSIPIITIGASTTALYYSMFKIKHDEDYGMTKMFFHSFSQNIKQGCGLTLIFIIIGFLLYLDIDVYSFTDNVFGNIVKVIVVILIIIWGILVSYSFPLLARFENSIKDILKNAFMIGLGNLGKTISIIVLNSVPVVLALVVPMLFLYSTPIWLLLGFSVIAYMNAGILKKIFEKYEVEEI